MKEPVFMNEKVFDKIIDILQTSSMSINQITQQPEFPSRDCFYRYLHNNENQFKRYVKARKAQVVVCCDEMLEIADDADNDRLINHDGEAGNMAAVRRSEVRINTRLKLAQLLRSKMYNPEDTYINIKHGNERESMNEIVNKFRSGEISAQESMQALTVFEKSIDSQYKHEIAELIDKMKKEDSEKV